MADTSCRSWWLFAAFVGDRRGCGDKKGRLICTAHNVWIYSESKAIRNSVIKNIVVAVARWSRSILPLYTLTS
jgi:hypothetical protein